MTSDAPRASLKWSVPFGAFASTALTMLVCLYVSGWDPVAPMAAVYLIVGMASPLGGRSFLSMAGPFIAATVGSVSYILFSLPTAIFLGVFTGVLGLVPFATGALFGWAALKRRTDGTSSAFLRWLMVPALLMAVQIAITATDLRRRSDAGIRVVLLEETPLGSSPDAARAAATARGWIVEEATPNRPRHQVVARAGSYLGLPFEVYVTVTWVFDQDGRLLGIFVTKNVDAL